MNARFCLALTLAAIAILAALASNAVAQTRMDASLTATQACPATTSTRGTEADAPKLTPGQSYRVVGKNRADATFYQILLDGQRRWIDVGCGQIGTSSQPSPQRSASGASYVFAMSWEPAFCQGHADRPECSPNDAGAAGRQLSLHGLWPQPRGRAYCGVAPALKDADRAHRWESLPEPEITAQTSRRLGAVMPGLQSGLERHEWIVHGTCSGLPADAYFNRAADLAEQLNATAIPALFAQNEGRTLSAGTIRGAFDSAFGPGAGNRVLISCQSQGRIIEELEISLAGDVIGSAKLADLIGAGDTVKAGCPAGLVTQPGR